MSETVATVEIAGSGSPSYLTPRKAAPPSWPSPSTLLSSVLTSFITVTVASHRDTVFLTRGHQRIMDRALRRSVRIIA